MFSAPIISALAFLVTVSATGAPKSSDQLSLGPEGKPLIRRESIPKAQQASAVFNSDVEASVSPSVDGQSMIQKSEASEATTSPMRSCRHWTYDDTTNPNRMKAGHFCDDGTEYTSAADGSVTMYDELSKCATWDQGGGGFYVSYLYCPTVRSCRSPSFNDAANPKRMHYGDEYCADTTDATAAASGAALTQTELDNCKQWVPQGGSHFTPSQDLCGNEGDATVTKCNSFTCPADWYLRRDAADIPCVGAVCLKATDKYRCCQALTREKENAKCGGAEALNWIEDWSLDECLEWSLNNGFTFFVYGKGSKARRCWWMKSEAPATCTGDDCCACAANNIQGDPRRFGCNWGVDEYDFYKLT